MKSTNRMGSCYSNFDPAKNKISKWKDPPHTRLTTEYGRNLDFLSWNVEAVVVGMSVLLSSSKKRVNYLGKLLPFIEINQTFLIACSFLFCWYFSFCWQSPFHPGSCRRCHHPCRQRPRGIEDVRAKTITPLGTK
jgi:hypothetical protein